MCRSKRGGPYIQWEYQPEAKATYEGIRQHLQQVYNRTFSYGTVVQLCIPRNKRRMSAKWY